MDAGVARVEGRGRPGARMREEAEQRSILRSLRLIRQHRRVRPNSPVAKAYERQLIDASRAKARAIMRIHGVESYVIENIATRWDEADKKRRGRRYA